MKNESSIRFFLKNHNREHWKNGIILENEVYTALLKTLERDCRVLRSFRIMDYR